MAEAERNTTNLEALLKGSTILIISNLCLKAINFFLLPLYTAYLTPGMLGVSDTITTFTGFLLPLLTMGLDSAFSAFYFEKGEPNRSGKVFSTLGLAFLALGVLPLVGFAFARPLSILVFHSSEYSPIIRLALASITFNLWYLPFSLELRLQNRMAAFGFVNVASSLLMILLNILFVSIMHLGEYSLVLSTMIVHAAQIGLFALFVRRFPEWKNADRVLFRSMLAFSLPLVPMTVMNWVLTLSDRAVILHYWGEDYVGLYGIGTRFTTMVNVIVSAIMTAYTTFAFGNQENEDARNQYSKVFQVVSLGLLFIAFSVSVFGREIVSLLNSDYADSYRPLRDLMFAQALFGMTSIVGYGIYFKKASKYSLYAVSTAAIVNLLLNLLLIPRVGYSIAATTTLVGYLIQLIITYAVSERLYPCDYGLKRIGALTAGLYLICFFCRYAPIGIKLFIWCSSICVTLVLFYAELKQMVQFVVATIRRHPQGQ